MEVTLQLFINKKNNKVLYAEAGKEFVDFLGHLLVLPVGVVVGLMQNGSTAGSLGSLYDSFKNLDSVYFDFDYSKEIMLKPPLVRGNSSLLGDSVSSSLSIDLCVCSRKNTEYCRKFVSSQRRSCTSCYNDPEYWEGGYVNSAATFMVMDDLSVKPLSTNTYIELLSSLNLNACTDLERKEVNVGKDQVLMLLGVLLYSKTVLTDVFVGN